MESSIVPAAAFPGPSAWPSARCRRDHAFKRAVEATIVRNEIITIPSKLFFVTCRLLIGGGGQPKESGQLILRLAAYSIPTISTGCA